MASLGDLFFDINFRTANADKTIDNLKTKIKSLTGEGVNIGMEKNDKVLKNVNAAWQKYVTSTTAAGKSIAYANKLTGGQNRLWQQQLVILNSAKGSIDRYAATINYLKSVYAGLGEAERRGIKGQTIDKRIARLQQELNAIKQNSAAWNTNTAARQRNASVGMTAMSTTVQSLMRQNSILTSLGNMAKNYVGVFGAVSFLRSLVRVSGEFEYQYRALQSIMQSASQAKELFGQIQGLAVESPYRFQELLSFSKQLSAFQVPNRELFDTTKRLADIASGVGVDMQRIILAYGQVRSASVLRGQELRQFTEAGIPMVRALADEFTRLEGRVVSTGEVFGRISKREVPFEMVKKILFDLTKEGGKFYDHQFKQAQTLKGKVQKLADAYQIMLYQIGNSGANNALKKSLDAITNALSNWKRTLEWLVNIGAVMGARKLMNIGKAVQVGSAASIKEAYMLKKRAQAEEMLLSRPGSDFGRGSMFSTYYRTSGRMLNRDWVDLAKRTQGEIQLTDAQVKRLFVMGKLKKADMEAIGAARGWSQAQIQVFTNMGKMERMGKAVSVAMGGVANSLRSLWSMAWPMLLITSIMDAYRLIAGSTTDITDNVKSQFASIYEELSKFNKDYAAAFENITLRPNVTLDTGELQSMWSALRERIEQLPGSDSQLAKLDIIPDLKERNKEAIEYLRSMERLSDYFSNFRKETIELEEDSNFLFWTVSEGLNTLAKDIQSLPQLEFKPMIGLAVNTASYSAFDKSAEENITQNLVPMLQDAMEQGMSDPATINAIIKNYEVALQEAAPNLTGKAMRRFEIDVVESLRNIAKNSEGEFSNAISSWIGDASNLPDNVFKSFVDDMRDYAEKNNISLQDAFAESSHATIKKIATEITNQALWTKTDVWKYFALLKSQIESTPIIQRILISLGFAKDSSNSQVLDALMGGVKNRMRSVPHPRIEGKTTAERQKSYEQNRKEILEDISTKEKENALLKKNRSLTVEQIALRDANTQAINSNRTALRELEDERSAYGLEYSATGDPKAEAKAANKAASDAKRRTAEANKAENALVKSIRREWEEKKAAIAEYNKFVELIGREEAKREFDALFEKGESLYSGADLDKYAGKGEIDLLDELIKKLSSDKTEAGKKLLSDIRKARQKMYTEQEFARLKREIDAAKEMLSLDKEAWSLYDKILEQTNDEALASLSLINGRTANRITGEKYFTSFRDELRKTIERQLKEQKIDITLDDLVAMSSDRKKLSETMFDKKASEELQDNIKQFIQLGDDGVRAWIEKLSGYADALMKEDDKIKREESRFAQERIDFAESLQQKFGKLDIELPGTGLHINLTDMLKDMKTEKQLDDFLSLFGNQFDKQIYTFLDRFRNAFRHSAEEIVNISSEALRGSKVWEYLFKDVENETIEMVKKRQQILDKALKDVQKTENGNYRIKFGDKWFDISAKDLEKLRQQSRKISMAVGRNNPFKTLENAWKRYMEARKKAKENPTIENIEEEANAWEEYVKAMQAAKAVLHEIVGLAGEVADAFGASKESIDGVFGAIDGIGQAVLSYKTGDIAGMVSGIAGAFSSLFSFFSHHDENLEEQIKRSQTRASQIENIYDSISRAMERSLGGAYTMRGDEKSLEMLRERIKYLEQIKEGHADIESWDDIREAAYTKHHTAYEDELEAYKELVSAYNNGSFYKAQLALLKARREEVQKQLDLEKDKKDKDDGAIADYQKDINELDDQIRFFAEDTLKELMDIDLKSWAADISSAIVDAFASGADAAKAFDDTVADIIKNVIKQMTSLYIIEPALENMRNYLFGEDGKGGVFGSDFKLTEDEIPGLITELMTVKDRIGEANDLFNVINDAAKKVGIDLTNQSGEGTLGKGIQSITENTADLLASYLNAIRADVSMLRILAESNDSINSPLAQMQIQQMNSVIANTLRNAEAAERIETALNSVIAVSANGKKLRV